MGSWHVQAQVPGQLKQAWAAPCPGAAAPWPPSDGVGQLAVCRVNRRAGATVEAGMHPAKHKHRRSAGLPCTPGPRTAVRVSASYLWRGGDLGAWQPLARQDELGRLTLASPAKQGAREPAREPWVSRCPPSIWCSPGSLPERELSHSFPCNLGSVFHLRMPVPSSLKYSCYEY